MPRPKKPEPPATLHWNERTHYGTHGKAPVYLDDEYTFHDEEKLEHDAEVAIENLATFRKEFDRNNRRRQHYQEMGFPPVGDEMYQQRAIEAELSWRQKMRDWEEAEKSLSRDPEDWLKGPRMTQTEASLRFAMYVIREGHAVSDVAVTLAGRELTRVKPRPRFPVEEFLERNGCQRRITRNGHRDWRARYSIEGSAVSLRLSDERTTCDVLANAAEDSRIIGYVGGGLVRPTRGPAEHVTLRALVGRALSHVDAQSLDLLMIVVPRSEQTRKIAKAMREAPRVMRAGLSVCTVDRQGYVEGLPFPERFRVA